MQLRKPARWAFPRSGAPLTIAGRRPSLFLPLWERTGVPRVYGQKSYGVTPVFIDSPTWAVERAGAELSFDGSNDHLAIDPAVNFDYARNPFTWLLVFRTTSSIAAAFASAANGSGNNPLCQIVNTSIAGTDGIAFSLRDNANNFISVGHSTTAHRDGHPHVAIATFDGTSGSTPSGHRLWLDGVVHTDEQDTSSGYVATTFNRRALGGLRRFSSPNFCAVQIIAFAELHGWAAPADSIPDITRQALSWLDKPRTIYLAASAGGEQHSGNAEISAVAAIAAAGTKTGIGAAAIDVSAELVAGGAKRAGGDAEISAAGTVAAAGVKHASGSATVSAAAAVTTSGTKMALGQAAIDAGAAADGAGTKTAIGEAEISAVGTVTAAGGAGVGGSVTITAVGSISASGQKGAVASAELAASADVDAAGAKTARGQAETAATAEIVCLGTKRAGGAVSIATAAEIIATWSTQRFGSVVISTVAVVVAGGGQVGAGDVGRISLTGRVDGPAELEGRYSPTIRLTGRT